MQQPSFIYNDLRKRYPIIFPVLHNFFQENMNDIKT